MAYFQPPADCSLRVLLVQADADSAWRTARFLQRHDITPSVAAHARAALEETAARHFDAVVVDGALPDASAVDLCRALRQRSDVPLLLAFAPDAEDDRIAGLDAGADDCIARPLALRELVARIRAHVRRARGQLGPVAGTIRVGHLELEPRSFSARLAGRPVPFTGYEFKLLRMLAERAGRVVRREELIELAGGSADEAFDRSIDGHISRIRRKLDDDAKRPRLLKTVRGAGYLLMPAADA
jgi:two-component system, OmpR family, response regulator